MSENQVCNRISQTYRWWDLYYCGKEEPHDTLVDGKQLSRLRTSNPRGMVFIPPVSKGGL